MRHLILILLTCFLITIQGCAYPRSPYPYWGGYSPPPRLSVGIGYPPYGFYNYPAYSANYSPYFFRPHGFGGYWEGRRR